MIIGVNLEKFLMNRKAFREIIAIPQNKPKKKAKIKGLIKMCGEN